MRDDAKPVFTMRAVVSLLLKEIRRDPLLWLLALVPVVLAAQVLMPDAHTCGFRFNPAGCSDVKPAGIPI
jgi:hypothetical protein